MLLAVTLIEYLQRPNVILSVMLAVFGVAFALLAKRITRAIRKTKDVRDDDAILVVLKIIGLMLILVGLILMVVEF